MSPPQPTKLRRAGSESLAPAAEAVADLGKFDAPGDNLWRGFDLGKLGAALTQIHVAQVVWRQLADCLSQALEDQALALCQGARAPLAVLAQDGVHDSLMDDLIAQSPQCPFSKQPNQIIANLRSARCDEPARVIYEFIEHYWGWTVGHSAEGVPIHLMMFGAEPLGPTDMALNARRLARFVAASMASEKNRRQLVSELSAETQGLRISAAAALRSKLDQWLLSNDD